MEGSPVLQHSCQDKVDDSNGGCRCTAAASGLPNMLFVAYLALKLLAHTEF